MNQTSEYWYICVKENEGRLDGGPHWCSYRIDVRQIRNAEEENGRMFGDGQVSLASQFDFLLRFFSDLLFRFDLLGDLLRRGQDLDGRFVLQQVTLFARECAR